MHVVEMMVAPAQDENRRVNRFLGGGWHVAGPVSPHEPTEDQGMWDRGRTARDG